MPADEPLVSDRLMLIVIMVVSLVWGISMLFSFINQAYSPPEGVNLAFGAVTGYLFNRQIRRD